MNKEEFLEVLSCQQWSGLTIKDFCVNEAYIKSNFYYWKGQFSLSQPYHAERYASEKFAPVNLTSPSTTTPSYDRVAMESKEIRIEFLGNIILRFSGVDESHADMQLLTLYVGSKIMLVLTYNILKYKY